MRIFFFYCRKTDDVDPSNCNNHHSESTDTNSIKNDKIDDPMDTKSFPSFIPNADDPQSHLANLAGILYLLTLAKEEERQSQ